MHLASGTCILPRLLQWSGNGVFHKCCISTLKSLMLDVATKQGLTLP